MKKMDAILNMIEACGVTLEELIQYNSERTQPQADSNKITNNNNNHSSGFSQTWVELSDACPDVAQAALEEAKRAKPSLSKVTLKRLWQDFVAFNRLKKRQGAIRLSAFFGFLRVWEDRLGATEGSQQVQKEPKPVPALSPSKKEFQQLCSKAKAGERHRYETELKRIWGAGKYIEEIQRLMSQWNVGRFQASLALHGQAVKDGVIQV